MSKSSIIIIIILFCLGKTFGNYPVFDYRTRMRVLLVPADLRAGSVIYRLRGSDPNFDYPLTFSVAGTLKTSNKPCYRWSY